MKTNLLFAFLISILSISCTLPQTQNIIARPMTVTDYIPAGQMYVHNFVELHHSAESGNSKAQYELGKLYANGLGVPKNHRTAMQWWEKAAVQDYAPAQYSLGLMYFNGDGVTYDFQEGCKWIQAAAIHGIIEANESYRRLCPQ